MNGSSIRAISCGGGSLLGFSTSSTAPLVRVTRYTTVGAVVSRVRSNSRSSRSWTISRCSSPRNPQRNPNPSASDVSGSKENDGVVQLELLQRPLEVEVVLALDRVQAREDHGPDLAEARQRARGGAVRLGDGVPHSALPDVADAGDDVADLSGRQAVHRRASAGVKTPTWLTSKTVPADMNWIRIPGATLPVVDPHVAR